MIRAKQREQSEWRDELSYLAMMLANGGDDLVGYEPEQIARYVGLQAAHANWEHRTDLAAILMLVAAAAGKCQFGWAMTIVETQAVPSLEVGAGMLSREGEFRARMLASARRIDSLLKLGAPDQILHNEICLLAERGMAHKLGREPQLDPAWSPMVKLLRDLFWTETPSV